MSFHLSAEDIRIDDNHILRARLQTESGDWNDAEIDLDQHLGNQDGMSPPCPSTSPSRDLAALPT